MAAPLRRKYGPLEAVEFPAPGDAPVILVLHGYGADMSDLVPISQMTLPVPARWVFLNGPVPVEAYGGRAWWPIAPERFERIEREGRPVSLAADHPPRMDESARDVAVAIEEMKVGWDRLIIGGFSQGAMLSLEVALNASKSPLGLFLLSGSLVNEKGLAGRVAKRAGLPFFQSHGRQDPLLGFADAKKLNSVLSAAGWESIWLEFDGGHMLPQDALEGLEGYLGDRLKAAR